MALKRLLSLIATSGVTPRIAAVARWTESHETDDAEPDYGAFVDDEGRVIEGTQPVRAFLETDDPSRLELAPSTARGLPTDATLVFLDWGRQNLDWNEIFELWEAWEAQGMIADCGAVGVTWKYASHWVAPGWIAFRGADGSPLSVTVQKLKAPSFLEKASKILGTETETAPGEPLPMLPFTIDDLKDASRAWPQGVA